MKKNVAVIVGLLVAAAVVLTSAAIEALKGQRPDFGWKPAAASPAFTSWLSHKLQPGATSI